MHLQAALRVQNPLSYEPATTASVKYALRNAPDDLEEVVQRRIEVSRIIRLLAEACADENAELLKLCEPSVARVLQAFGTKNVALMREIAFVCDTNDISSPGLLLIGLPMLGWAPGADGLMPRLKPPLQSVEEFLQSREERNEKILNSIKASTDTELQAEAFRKTTDEVERGVLVGPYMAVEDIPLPDVALVPRHGIWEQHGEAVSPTVRCIDDMLVGEQNETVGTISSHRPTDPDALVAQVRAVRERYHALPLSGWPCDLKSAYKQVPNDPAKLKWCVIVIWSPKHGRAVFYVAMCQLFGGKSPT